MAEVVFETERLSARRLEPGAAARGCSVYYLTTLRFQAPDFYRKHGYASVAEIRGYPQDITKHLMVKKTAAPQGTRA